MNLTHDKMLHGQKMAGMEAHVDVKTMDGYLLHLFYDSFTKKCYSQIWKTS